MKDQTIQTPRPEALAPANVMRQRAQKERDEKRKDEAWDDLGNTLREMAKGDDLGPLGQTGWNE